MQEISHVKVGKSQNYLLQGESRRTGPTPKHLLLIGQKLYHHLFWIISLRRGLSFLTHPVVPAEETFILFDSVLTMGPKALKQSHLTRLRFISKMQALEHIYNKVLMLYTSQYNILDVGFSHTKVSPKVNQNDILLLPKIQAFVRWTLLGEHLSEHGRLPLKISRFPRMHLFSFTVLYIEATECNMSC